MINFIYLLLITALSLTAVGCITPPPQLEPRILSEKELRLVTLISKGKDYARAGRVDLAEAEFREALRLAPERSSIVSDLGFVLQRQGRLSEAKELYERAVQLAPENLPARDNLARLLYETGEDELARQQYETLLDYYFGYWQLSNLPAEQRSFSAKDLVSAIRNLSIIETALGRTDEGVCLSKYVVSLGNPLYPPLLHGRYLMSLEDYGAAYNYYSNLLLESPEKQLTPPLFLDFAALLYSRSEKEKASQATIRVTSSPEATPRERYAARMLRLLAEVVRVEGSDVKWRDDETQERTKAELLEDFKEVCDYSFDANFPLWPSEVLGKLNSLQRDICPDAELRIGI